MTVEPAPTATTRRGPHVSRGGMLRLARRAAVSSAIATGALVALAAPSWAAHAGHESHHASHDAVVSHASSHSRPAGDRGASAVGHTADRTAAPQPKRNAASGPAQGHSAVASAHSSAHYVVPASRTTSPDSTPAQKSTVAADAQSAPKDSATVESAQAGTTPAQSTPAQAAPEQAAPMNAAPAQMEAPPAGGTSTTDAPATEQQPASAEQAPAETSSADSSDAEDPAASSDPTAASTPTSPSDDPASAQPQTSSSALPIAALTDTVATTIESAPGVAATVVHQTVDTVSSVGATVDSVAQQVAPQLGGGLTTPLLAPTLRTVSNLTDGVLRTADDVVTRPTASVVRSVGQQVQSSADGVGGAVGFIVTPVLGGNTRTSDPTQPGQPSQPDPNGPGTQTTDEPGDDQGGTSTGVVTTTGSDGPAVGPHGAILHSPAGNAAAPAMPVSSAPAFLPGAGLSAPVGASTDRVAPQDAVVNGSNTGGGSDLRIPVNDDQSPSGGGSGQTSGGSSVAMDLASSWLPGAARPAVPSADGWRLPGSVSFEPGHSPD